jgi:hypothetical protein
MNVPRSYSDLPKFEELPSDQRLRIQQWIEELDSVERPLQKSLQRVAEVMGCSFPTARTKYYAWKNSGDWHVLINYANLPYHDKKRKSFYEWWHKLCLQHKNTREAYREFLDLFNTRKPIPGLPIRNRKRLPSGFGYHSLISHAPTKFERQALALERTKISNS